MAPSTTVILNGAGDLMCERCSFLRPGENLKEGVTKHFCELFLPQEDPDCPDEDEEGLGVLPGSLLPMRDSECLKGSTPVKQGFEVTVEHPIIQVRARNIIPLRHAIWCSVAGSEPFANDIVIKRWNGPGKIVVMLDSHNFDFYDADALVTVVEVPWNAHSLNTWRAREREFLASEPDVTLENGAGI